MYDRRYVLRPGTDSIHSQLSEPRISVPSDGVGVTRGIIDGPSMPSFSTLYGTRSKIDRRIDRRDIELGPGPSWDQGQDKIVVESIAILGKSLDVTPCGDSVKYIHKQIDVMTAGMSHDKD